MTDFVGKPRQSGKNIEKMVLDLTKKINQKDPDKTFKELNVNFIPLEELKSKKIEQLHYLCNQDILSGFYSSAATDEPILYGFDWDDQNNLQGTLTLMNSKPDLTVIFYKPKGIPPFAHSRDQFINLCTDAFLAKQTKIAKYWSLKAEVELCMTKEDVQTIIW